MNCICFLLLGIKTEFSNNLEEILSKDNLDSKLKTTTKAFVLPIVDLVVILSTKVQTEIENWVVIS